MTERVPGQSDPYPRTSLGPHEVDFFEQNGFLLVKGLLDEADVEHLREESAEIGSDADDLHTRTDSFRELGRDERIVGPMDQLVGSEAELDAMGFHTGRDGGGFRTARRDRDTGERIDAFVYLDDAVNCGRAYFIERSHAEPADVRTGSSTSQVDAVNDAAEVIPDAGDVVFVDDRTLRLIGPNSNDSKSLRQIVSVGFRSHGDSAAETTSN